MDWDLEEEILNDIMRFEFSPFLSALEFFVCKIKMEEILNYFFRNLKNITKFAVV